MYTVPLISRAIRTHQYKDPALGHWWRTIHIFLERTLEEFWPDQELIYPILSMGSSEARWGHFEPEDSLSLPCRINLNPYGLKDGLEAAEALAHELVHVWEWQSNHPTMFNVHTDYFHTAMFEIYGISTTGEDAVHHGNDGRWDEWLEENVDLNLGKFKFPGHDEE